VPKSTSIFEDFPWDPSARQFYSYAEVPYLAFNDNFPSITPGYSFALVATSTIYASSSGSHRFCLSSDDGSWLNVDDSRLIDNPGRHGIISVCEDMVLTEGLHNITVYYFQRLGGAVLLVTMDGILIAPKGKFLCSVLPCCCPGPGKSIYLCGNTGWAAGWGSGGGLFLEETGMEMNILFFFKEDSGGARI
jgi:hypothetical protein